MDAFVEKPGEKDGQRTKRFLEFLRNVPMPKGIWDEKLRKWVPNAQA